MIQSDFFLKEFQFYIWSYKETLGFTDLPSLCWSLSSRHVNAGFMGSRIQRWRNRTCRWVGQFQFRVRWFLTQNFRSQQVPCWAVGCLLMFTVSFCLGGLHNSWFVCIANKPLLRSPIRTMRCRISTLLTEMVVAKMSLAEPHSMGVWFFWKPKTYYWNEKQVFDFETLPNCLGVQLR